MNYLKTFKLSVILIFPLLLWGCFEDHASQFHLDDVNQVEWAPPNPRSSALSATISVPADETQPQTASFTVQLIGAHSGSDRTAGVTVASTNADEGVHFELSSTEVLIPANSSFGEVTVTVNSGNLDSGDSYSLTLELQPGSDLGVAANMKDLNLSIVKR